MCIRDSSRGTLRLEVKESEWVLEPEGRLVLLSDGFIDAVGGVTSVLEILNHLRGRDGNDTINEFVFRVKSELEGEDDMPAQDCTAAVMDLDARLIRLA